MIVYIVLAVVLVVLFVLAIMEYSDTINTNGIVSGIFLFFLFGSFVFMTIDNTAIRKNVETVPMTATVEDTYSALHRYGKNSYRTDYYIVYTFEDGERVTDSVGYSLYKDHKKGDTLDGAKVYYTTGITGINTYAYEIYWE